MFTCGDTAYLMRYHDGELPPAERRAVERHVADCSACAGELAALRALSRSLSGLEPPPLPEGMVERIRTSLKRPDEVVVLRMCRRVAAAAAAVLVVCLPWLWYARVWEPSARQAPSAWEVAAMTLDEPTVQEGAAGAAALWVARDLSQEGKQ